MKGDKIDMAARGQVTGPALQDPAEQVGLPPLEAAGDLDAPYATAESIAEVRSMSAATVDTYLAPARQRMRIKGISTTKPDTLLRNSIAIRPARTRHRTGRA